MTWWNDRMMPISSTAMIRPLSHGLARKALKIWRCKHERDQAAQDQEDQHPNEEDAG